MISLRRALPRAVTLVAALLLFVAVPSTTASMAAATPQPGFVATGSNLLANSGFEHPTPDRTGPAAWATDVGYPAVTMSWDRVVAHSGRHSVRITSSSPADVRWVQQVAVRPHTLYRLTGWIRTSQVTPSPESADTGANIGFLGLWDRSVAVVGTRGWTEVTITVDSGDLTRLTVAARLGFWSGLATGTAWFDDLNLTPVTATDRLVNGGFERGPRLAGAIPASWGALQSVPTSTLTWDRQVAHSGRYSVRIDSPAPNDALWVQGVAVRPHTLYRLSGWIRTSNVAHTAEIVDAGANLSFLGGWDYSTPVHDTHGWTHVSVTGDSGDQNYMFIAARLGYWSGFTTGTAWFDDLTLTPLG